MKPVVIDNFIDKQSFQDLQNVMFGENFCWNYNEHIDYIDEQEKFRFQFTHTFYRQNIGPSSQQYGKLSHILNKIKPKEIYRIKANLLSRTSEIVENSFHVDIADLGILPWTTSILYMNTNNGYTEFETGAKVESKENRMLVFPAEMKHRGTSCTDKKIRVVINFNYFT